MPQRDLVIGLDSSTTAVKAAVWDRYGSCLALGRASLPVLKPRPTWHEQPATAWWDAMRQALREVTKQVNERRLAALCIAPQRETFVLTDETGHPLHNAVLWMDERCRDLLPEIEHTVGKERFHQETGKPLSANLTLGKLLWLSRNEPRLNTKSTRVHDVHAYLAYRLTGRHATSWGCADPTGLFDMRNNRWSEYLIRTAGFQVSQFPEAVAPGEIIGPILDEAAQDCGLPSGLPLVAGLGDGQAAGLGVGAILPGEMYLNLGTAAITGTYSEQYQVSQAFRTMYGGIAGAYFLETVLLGGTYTISWFVDQFSAIDLPSLPPGTSAESVLEEEARKVAPGADGLMLVPYWNSVMNPYWNAAASGIMVGWRGAHGRAHFYRAILEGIAYELRLHVQGVENALSQQVEKCIAVGGGARSSLWRQIITDVIQRPVYTSEANEATALGAGILAAAAVGLHTGVASAVRSMTHRSTHCIFPNAEHSQAYDKLFTDVYQNLYPALAPILDRLANIAALADGESR